MKSRKPVTQFVLMGMVVGMGMCLAACLEVHNDDVVDGGNDNSCEMCHSLGESAAHTAHLTPQVFGQPMVCGDCHMIPDDWYVEGHMDGDVQVIFPEGSIARAQGLEPEWDGAKCANVHCHGAGLSGGTYTEPNWSDTLEMGMQCGMCHAIPPQDAHPTSGACSSCHSAAYVDGKLDMDVHINGYIDFASTSDGGVEQ